MKKIWTWLWIAAIAVVLVFGILYFVKSKDEPVAEPTFNEYMMQDFEFAQTLSSPTAAIRFYEVQTVLNGNLDTLAPENVKVVQSTSVFTKCDTVYFLTRTAGVEGFELDSTFGIWVDSSPILDMNVNISFEDAVKAMYEYGVVPAGDKMVFREPITPDVREPLYIFGTYDSRFVGVNSATREVKVLDEDIPEEQEE